MSKTGFLATLLLVFITVYSCVQSFPTGDGHGHSARSTASRASGSASEYEFYEPHRVVAFTDLPGVKRHLKEPYANSNFPKMSAAEMFRALINLRRYK
uniref:Pro-kuma_activ domain-containing protein n=1 Tax=Steinernema glaseri TaxID=37863 RepID=A0A1I7ZQC4_9BILA